MPPHPRRLENAVDALVGVAALTSRWAERLLAAHEPPLTMAQYLVLRSVAREPMTAAELARRAGVSGPAASQLTSAIEQAGWIKRKQRADDRRSHDLTLTDAGGRVLSSAAEMLGNRVGPLLADVPAPELHAVERLLTVLEVALAGSPPPRRPHPPRAPEGGPVRRR